MELVFVTFESDSSLEQVVARFRERAPRFRDMGGLVQKFYIHDPESGRVGGVYLFDSEDSRDALFDSEIHAKLRSDSDVRNLDIATFQVVFPLYDMGAVKGAADGWR